MRRLPVAVLAVLLAAGSASLFAGCAGEKKESAGKVPGGSSAAPAYGDAIVEGSIGDVSGFISAVTSD